MSVTIPVELAEEVGLHRGSAVQWERIADGRLALRTEASRHAAADRLHGMLKGYLKSGESAVADLIREREEDAIREEEA